MGEKKKIGGNEPQDHIYKLSDQDLQLQILDQMDFKGKGAGRERDIRR